jgi:23S rRNA (guanosine2251-2'-O)-methyltransferase
VGSAIGGEQVEGRRAVVELLRAGTRRVRRIWIARDLAADDLVEEILDRARRAGIGVESVTRDALQARAQTDAPQGVVAKADALIPAELDDLLEADRVFLVALDGVTDPRNLGAVMRAAESAGATGVLLPRHRSARVTPVVAKAAAGAVEYLPIAPVSGVPAALERAARKGCWSVGLDERATTSLFDCPVADQRVIVVLGAEGRGLGRLTRERCDLLVHIPMRGSLASLNVAAAATLACHELARRRGD